MCAVASALSTGTMTALQADQRDGYDHYAGIFFPCLALLLTACYCVFAAGADPHTQPLQEPCMIFFLPLGACNASGFVHSAAQGWGNGLNLSWLILG